MAETAAPKNARELHSFAEFYPFYLSEHRDRTCRRLHFVGSTLALLCALLAVWTGRWQLFVPLALLCGYGFAWIGHFGFEKNKPASFKRPLYSFMGDWVMYKDIWTGRIRF
ncbi:MAG TPA: Mpo1-like protein [Burkholderiaceae bacterium]|nr:Mpo1-like protein [Burkholderiaceae bacterium]